MSIARCGSVWEANVEKKIFPLHLLSPRYFQEDRYLSKSTFFLIILIHQIPKMTRFKKGVMALKTHFDLFAITMSPELRTALTFS